MKKDTLYKRSLKSLQEFIAETPADELATLISECVKMEIEGPTFDEYLDKLQKVLIDLEWNPIHFEAISLIKPDLKKYMIEYNDDFYPPPRSKRNLITNKKDSAIFAESFFFLLLYYG